MLARMAAVSFLRFFGELADSSLTVAASIASNFELLDEVFEPRALASVRARGLNGSSETASKDEEAMTDDGLEWISVTKRLVRGAGLKTEVTKSSNVVFSL